MENTEKFVVGVFPLDHAKQMRAELAKHNVELELVHNDETCSRTLGRVTIEVHVDKQHLQVVAKLFTEQFAKNLGLSNFDTSLLGEVYDPTKGEATCPACGFKFATTNTECPDCGLAFA